MLPHFCVRMEHIVKPQSSLVSIQPRTLHASKLISLLACRVRGFFCVYRILFVCVDWWSLPLPLGRRAASQLAPRARRACSASSTTLHTQHATGSRARAASKPCRHHAACSLSTIGSLTGDHLMRPRVLCTCQNDCLIIPDDCGTALVCSTSMCSTTPLAPLDQSNPEPRECVTGSTYRWKCLKKSERF